MQNVRQMSPGGLETLVCNNATQDCVTLVVFPMPPSPHLEAQEIAEGQWAGKMEGKRDEAAHSSYSLCRFPSLANLAVENGIKFNLNE